MKFLRFLKVLAGNAEKDDEQTKVSKRAYDEIVRCLKKKKRGAKGVFWGIV